MNENETNNNLLNKRYLTLAIITFIVANYMALSLKFLTDVDTYKFAIYSICFVGFLIVATIVINLFLRKRRDFTALISGCLVIILIFICGIVRVHLVSTKFKNDALFISQCTAIKGIVTEQINISSSGKSHAVTAEVRETYTDKGFIKVDHPIKVLLFIPTTSSITPCFGDSFECKLDFQISKEPSFKGAYDYNRSLLQKKVCYASTATKYNTLSEGYNLNLVGRLMKFGIKARSTISEACKLTIYTSDEAALLVGILIGDVSGFSDSLYESYTKSGLIHVASVSGMHTSYLFIVISLLLSLFKIPKRFYSLIVIPVLIFFTAIALFTPSVCRAVIMLSVMLMAPLFRRENDSITALAISAVIIIFNNPYSLESYSLLLSYSATLGLLIFASPILKRLRPNAESVSKTNSHNTLTGIFNYVANSVSISLGATIGISYFTAKFFGKISLGGIIANLLIFPLVAIIFIGGFVNCLLYYIYRPLSYIVGTFVLKPTLFITNKISLFFANDVFTIPTPRPNIGVFILLVVIFYILYILLSSSNRNKNLN